jgi:hypothetical protein
MLVSLSVGSARAATVLAGVDSSVPRGHVCAKYR